MEHHGSEIKWQPQLCSLFTQDFDQQTVNAVRTNLLWFTSQQGLFTPNCESLFPHHITHSRTAKVLHSQPQSGLNTSHEVIKLILLLLVPRPPDAPVEEPLEAKRRAESTALQTQCNQVETSPQGITSLKIHVTVPYTAQYTQSHLSCLHKDFCVSMLKIHNNLCPTSSKGSEQLKPGFEKQD